MTDEEEVAVPESKSRRMGWLDIPLCLLNFVTGTTHIAAAVLSDISMIVAGHSNHLRDEREFRGIVKNYDHTYGVGPGGPESTD